MRGHDLHRDIDFAHLGAGDEELKDEWRQTLSGYPNAPRSDAAAWGGLRG